MSIMHKALRSLAALALGGALLASPALAQTDLGPTLNKIRDNGAIYVGHRESSIPFSYVLSGTENEQPKGYSWELCSHVVAAVREKVGKPDLNVVPVSLSASTRLMMVKIGMADIECGVTTNNVARQKQVAFSNTFFVSEVKIMVRKDSGFKSLNDLAGKAVVTTTGSTADRLVKAAALTRNITFNYMIGRNHYESMRMLSEGRAQAFVADDALLAGQQAEQEDPSQFAYLDESLSIEPYGFVLRRDDPQFKALVDQALVGLMTSGELEKIYNKWFLEPFPPKGHNLNLPMSDLLKAAIQYPNDQPAQ